MSQVNIKGTDTHQTPPEGFFAYKFNSLGQPGIVDADGSFTLLDTGDSSTKNVVANKGLGLEADLPTIFVTGDVYVTTDSYRVYTAYNDSSWTYVDLAETQLVTDTTKAYKELWQFIEGVLVLLVTETITTFIALEDTPSAYSEGDPDDKLIINETGDRLIFAPSTTSSGFYDKTQISFDYDNITKEFSLNGTFKFVTANGKKYEVTDDSIIITPLSGLIYIYYDNNGNLQQLANPNRDTQYSYMLQTLPVAYFLYNLTFGAPTFIGNYLKGRVSSGLWVKNFFDIQVYVFTGITVFGETIGDGSLDAHVQFGLSEGELLFTDTKHNSPTRQTTDTWNVGYFSGSEAIGIPDNPFLVLTDNDLGVGTTGRAVYNNNGSPLPANSGNYVWYFVMTTVDIDPVDRTLSFMGNSQYGNQSIAEDALSAEIIDIETKLPVRQGARLSYAVLLETKSTFVNSTKSRIIEILPIIQQEVSTTPSISIPDELINGGNADSLHSHDISNITNHYTPGDISFALSDETSDLTTDNDTEVEVIRAQTIESITFYVNTAPTGSAITVDILKNGTTILTSVIILPTGQKTVTITSPQISSTGLIVGDRIKADITQVGSTVAGTGAKIAIKSILV